MPENPASPTAGFPVRRVYICGNGKCTDRPAAQRVFEHLLSLIQAYHLDDFDAPARVKCQLAGCLDVCKNGATMVIQPDGIYYWNIDEKSAERIFFQHLLNNQPVEELIYRPND
ncbi:(2Fe-2S) ferredoxin domain-containing protein [Bellilinea sp.]|jgi:(2Fe-2S) ferredoxin